MTLSQRVITAVLVAVALLARAGSAAADDVSPAQIDEAIRKGVRFLKGGQHADGSFSGGSGIGFPNPPVRPYDRVPANTAFHLFVLLQCGVPTTDSVITKGFAYLRTAKLKGVFEHAGVIMAVRERYHWAAVEKPSGQRNGDAKQGLDDAGDQGEIDRQLLHVCVDKVVGWQRRVGGWRYGYSELAYEDGDADVVSTYLALSGLKAARACGLSVPARVFADAARYLVAEQDPTGEPVKPTETRGGDGEWSPLSGDRCRGWAYTGTSDRAWARNHTSARTASGVLALMICKSELQDTAWWRDGGESVDRAMHDGVAWIHEHWSPGLVSNPNGYGCIGYHWWVVSRPCLVGGLATLGRHNWYAEGAKTLVSIQQLTDEETGYWDVAPTDFQPSDNLNTSYALLFLKKHAHSLGISPIARASK